MFRLLAIVSCFCVVASVALAEGDIVNGKKLIKKWDCMRCHGLTGNDRSSKDRPIPMLAGQPAGYLVKAMNDYKTGARADFDNWPRMSRLVKGLSDQDIEDIAAYYEAQKRY